MALTQSDYRAATFQAFKVYRAHGMPKQYAYRRAVAIIKPLPESREAAQLRIAFNEFTRFSPTDPRRCKEGWAMCWQYARESLRP